MPGQSDATNLIKLVIELLIALIIIAVFVSFVFPPLCHLGVQLLCSL
jgi:hypothetical protein